MDDSSLNRANGDAGYRTWGLAGRGKSLHGLLPLSYLPLAKGRRLRKEAIFYAGCYWREIKLSCSKPFSSTLPGAALMLAAGILYSLHIRRPLDSSEAYTALAAAQSSCAGVIRIAMRFDPGKPPVYQVALHYLERVLGGSEMMLRAPSVIASMANIGLLLALGEAMFEPAVALGAALIWAVNPLAIIFGAWARDYALLITFSLAQLIVLWKLRTGRGSAAGVAVCGVLGAAMLYAHLCTALILAAEAALLMGAVWRREPTGKAWVALGLALMLFAPVIPPTVTQMRSVMVGHLYDWMGFAYHGSLLRKALAIAAVAAGIAALVFVPRFEADQRQPIRWCIGIGLIPPALLIAGSVAVRPMFAIRYVAPSVAILLLLLARLLASFGARVLRLSAIGIAAFLAFLYPCYGWYEPWRDIARIVASGSPDEPVFFEPIFTDPKDPLADRGQGFPQGFFRPAFDHYFSGPNPRRAVDPSRPEQARRIIAQAANAAHGAWLISMFDEHAARAELPTHCFEIEKKARSHDTILLHVVPLTAAPCDGD
jgi:hypothetical protein